MKMMMIMVIILMLDDDNAQKSSTNMTLWSKYTPFKYYYLLKKGPNKPGRGRLPPPLNGQCPFKNVFFLVWTPSLSCSILHIKSYQICNTSFIYTPAYLELVLIGFKLQAAGFGQNERVVLAWHAQL